MKKVVIGVLAVLGIALAGCVLPPRPVYPVHAPRQPISTEDVTRLVRAGVSEPVILEKFRSDGIAASPSPDDLVALKKAGASDTVIQAMLAARVGPPVALYIDSPSWNLYYDGPWGWGYPYGFYPWGWHFGYRHHW